MLKRKSTLSRLKVIDGIMAREREKNEKTIPGERYSRTEEIRLRTPLVHKPKNLAERRTLRRPNSIFTCVISGDKAKNDPCQDDLVVVKYKKAQIMSIFDGHGQLGHEIAKTCAYYLGRIDHFASKTNISKTLLQEPENALPELITKLDDWVKKTPDLNGADSGATGTVALVSEGKLHVAWVGDSKATLFVSSNTDFSDMLGLELTFDHNFSSLEEKERIEEAGGEIRSDPRMPSLMRLCDPANQEEMDPGLAMSKSIGDFNGRKLGLNCEADYCVVDLHNTSSIGQLAVDLGHARVSENYFKKKIAHAVLIVASDGLWNALSFREISEFLKRSLRINSGDAHLKSNLAASLCVEAKTRQREAFGPGAVIDDISAIATVFF